MKRVFAINRKSNLRYDSFELTESIRINFISRENKILLQETYLSNVLDFLVNENIREDLKNEYVIILTKEGKLVSKLIKSRNCTIPKIEICQNIFTEIFENTSPNFNVTLKDYKKHIYNNGFSNIWYIESCIQNPNNPTKIYKLYAVNFEKQECYKCIASDLKILINDCIRSYHKENELGPNAYVILNEWTDSLKPVKLPLKFNTNSLLKILKDKKEVNEDKENNQQEIEPTFITPYLDLTNRHIYIISSDNQVGMNNIKNMIENGKILVCCNPIEYDFKNLGWTYKLLKEIEYSISREITIKIDEEKDFAIDWTLI